MGIICLLIIIWAFSDGNFGDLLILFGILIALGLFLSYPGIGLLIVGLIILFYLLFHTEEPKEDNTVKSTSQTHDKEEVVSKPTEEIQNPKQIDIIEGKTDSSGKITTIDNHTLIIPKGTVLSRCQISWQMKWKTIYLGNTSLNQITES